MLLLRQSRILVVVAGLAIACAACQSKPAEKPEKQKPTAPVKTETPGKPQAVEPAPKVETKAALQDEPEPKVAEKAKPSPAASKPKQQQPAPPPPPTIPKVALSEELNASCLVKVGDAMPGAELPDAAGKISTLESLYGQKLTVVCLWTIGSHRSQLVALSALRDLTKEVADPFGPKGVRLVGINVSNTPDDVRKEVSQAGAKFPNLLDSKGEYFAKLAKDKRMPRIYLLDSGGRVLWFDVEYTRTSRRELVQGIRAALGEL
jgi:hypothetical protein